MDAILLFSGGLDSLVSAGLMLEEDPRRTVTCLFFDYDQHTVEVEWDAATKCMEHFPKNRITLMRRKLNDYHQYVKDVSLVGGGHIPTKDEDPSLYFIPGRNILFLLYAAVIGYPYGCRQIAYSPHQWVHAGDCLPQFIDALAEAFSWGFGMEKKRENYRIWSPLAHLDKPGVVREGTRLGLPLHLSWSCHDAQTKQCGVCHNCDERKLAYRLAKIPDPTEYLV
jgi:7-cyano-7-deazaguanine synthase